MTDPSITSLQDALSAEHAVIWGYGLVGGRVGAQVKPAVHHADTAHRARRDSVIGMIRAAGAAPVAPRASYETPFRVNDQNSALRLAAHLEEGAASAWRKVVGDTDDAHVRRSAISALSDCAVRATRWRMMVSPDKPATVAFPGR